MPGWGSLKLTSSGSVGGETVGTKEVLVVLEGGRKKKEKRFEVPVIVPRVSGTLEVEGPDELYPGEKQSLSMRFTYEEGDLEEVLIGFYVNARKVAEKTVVRGSSATAFYEVGPGRYVVAAKVGESVIASVNYEVKRLTPTISFEVLEGAKYPSGGTATLSFRIRPPTARVEKVEVRAPIVVKNVDIDNKERIVRVEFEGEPPSGEMDIHLTVRVANADGSEDQLEAEVTIPVELEEPVVVEWDKRIHDLIEALAEDTPRAPWLRNAQKLLEECEAKAEPFGYSCQVVRDTIEQVQEEVRQFSEQVDNVQALLGKGRVLDAIQAVLALWGKCREDGLYYGFMVCENLKALAVQVLERASDELDKLYSQGRIDEAVALAESAHALCRLRLPGTGMFCGRVDNVKVELDEINRVLNEAIYLDIPSYNPSKKIEAKLMVDMTGYKRVFEGVYVDLTPSSDYITNAKVINLPKLFPQTHFTDDLILESRFEGRIPIVYKICYKKYCINRRVDTGVGRIRIPVVSVDVPLKVDDFVGKRIAELAKYNPIPITPTPLPQGQLEIADYVCTGRLAAGGFSVTLYCEARDGEKVVIKIPKEIHDEIAGAHTVGQELFLRMKDELQAFDREAKILQLLDHPNIIKIKDYGVQPYPYLVFEYCDYGDLRRILNAIDGPMDPATALKVMIPVADAVRYGHEHEKGILHLDIKPHNILIDKTFVPKLTDYNIGRVMRTVSRKSRAKMYTPGFSAPEQVNDNLPEPREYSDVFALGATLYYMLTRTHVYSLDYWEVNHFRDKPKYTPIRQFNPDVPRDLDDIIASAVQVNPYERGYKTVRDFIVDLVGVYEEYYQE